MIDAGGPIAPLLEYLRRGQLQLTHVLLTHHHHDHVAELDAVLEAHPGTPVLIHPLERDIVARRHRHDGARRGDRVRARCGSSRCTLPVTPPGCCRCWSTGTDVFTGDTLFKGSVGGVRAPGHTTYADLKSSIMDKLLKLPRRRPGSTPATPIRRRSPTSSSTTASCGSGAALDPEGDEPCTAMGEQATLILLGDDYDGGHKAWVRWPDGSDDIVPGSQVQTAG